MILDIYPKEWKTDIQTIICMQMFITALFLTAKGLKKTQMSFNRWMSCAIYMWWMLLNHKKNEIMIRATWEWALKTLCYCEMSQTQNLHTVWVPLYDMPRIPKSVETEGRLVVARRWVEEMGSQWKMGTRFFFWKSFGIW